MFFSVKKYKFKVMFDYDAIMTHTHTHKIALCSIDFMEKLSENSAAKRKAKSGKNVYTCTYAFT